MSALPTNINPWEAHSTYSLLPLTYYLNMPCGFSFLIGKFNIGVSSSGKTQHFDCCMRRFVEVVAKPRQALQSAESRVRQIISGTARSGRNNADAEYPATWQDF